MLSKLNNIDTAYIIIGCIFILTIANMFRCAYAETGKSAYAHNYKRICTYNTIKILLI